MKFTLNIQSSEQLANICGGLDKNIEIRRRNYQYWMESLLRGLGQDNYIIPENQVGNSSFSFPIIEA